VVALAAYAAAREGLFAAPPAFSPAGWAAVLFIGTGSGATYFLLLWALGRAPASVVTAFIALGPVTAALLDAAIDRRLPGPAALAGLLCVAAGLAVAAVRPRGG
jgi:drug/metabolite transporter (DMT)-like permease